MYFNMAFFIDFTGEWTRRFYPNRISTGEAAREDWGEYVNINSSLLTKQSEVKRTRNGPLSRYVKLRVAYAPGIPETVSPPPTSKENDG